MRAQASADVPRATALLKALEDLGVTAVTSGAWVLTVPIEPVLSAVEAHAALAAIVEGGAVLWAEPSRDAPDRRLVAASAAGWSFAGAGETAVIEGQGPERVAEVRARAAQLFSKITDACEVAEPVPPPALFGGFAFRAARDADGACGCTAEVDSGGEHAGEDRARWRPFADARFVLPRWIYARNGSHAFLRLSLARRPSDLELEVLLDETRRVIAALTRPSNGARIGRRARIWMDELPAEAWRARVDAALASIGSGELGKVVAATGTRLVSAGHFDVLAALSRLDASHPSCVRFAFTPAESPAAAGSSTFLGATPERLVDKRGRIAHLDALAGTARRDPSDDDASARRLLESDKDRREHAYVVDFLSEALRPIASVSAASVPGVRNVRNLHHLWTPVRAKLAPGAHVLDLVERLHPTPAVCGVPREKALAWIEANESLARGWYAGAVGWLDGSGDGSFAVAIRSALVAGRQALVHAGAGIVEGSTPAAEHAEIRLKQATALAALGAVP